MAYTPEQKRNIALANRLSAGHAPRVRQALLEAMRVESNFRNLNYGDRDSLGVLQQRKQYYPNAGKNVGYDIKQFLMRADRANKQVGGSAGALAQAVQRSAFPGRYDEHAAQARALLGGRMAGGGGSGAPGSTSAGVSASSGASQDDFQAAMVNQLLSMAQGGGGGNPTDLLALAQMRQSMQQANDAAAQGATTPVQAGAKIRDAKGGINELFYDPLGAIKHGQNIAKIGGHTDHVHFAANNAAAQVRGMQHALAMGMHVSENDYVGQVHRVHVPDSNHYRVIGKVNGKKVSGAADISGTPAQMAAFYKWAARNF